MLYSRVNSSAATLTKTEQKAQLHLHRGCASPVLMAVLVCAKSVNLHTAVTK